MNLTGEQRLSYPWRPVSKQPQPVLGDGQVQLELRPFSGRVDEGGALRYTSAATSIALSPGETVIYAETSTETQDSTVSLGGGSKGKVREQQVLLISVELQQP